MKYSEHRNGPEQYYNWPDIINNLESGLCDADGERVAINAAGDWVTCACGNLCASLPRHSEGEPEDHELAILGYGFARTISHLVKAAPSQRRYYAQNARDLLANIEARSSKLLEAQS